MKRFPALFKDVSSIVGGIVVAGVLIFWSVPAVAAGFFLPTRGVESTARGGASVAPHSPALDSLWHNPAGLSLLDETSLTVDLAAVGLEVEHERADREMDDGSTREYDPVQNEAYPNTIPSVFVGGTTPIEDLNWAAGAYTQYAGSSTYPVQGPQRYVLIDNVGSGMGYLHAGVGWQVTDEIAVGAGFQNFMGSFRIVSTGSGYTGMFGDPEDRDLDMPAEATVTSLLNPTGNLGVTYRAHDNIQTGLSIQLPTRFADSDATIDARVPDHPAYDGAEVTDNRVDVAMTFPVYVRGGVRWIRESIDLEAAVVYQHWSVFDEVVITPHEAEVDGAAGVDSVPVQPMVVPQGFRNTVSVHLGGEYDLFESVDVRGGYVYERGAVPDERYSVFALDPDKHQLSSGGSWHIDNWTLDWTATFIMMPSKEITNSEVRQNNPSDPDDDHTIVVGNGTYDHFGYILGAGVNYRF